MFGYLDPGALTWDEVDPARHPFDKASVANVVSSLEPIRHFPSAPDLTGIVDPDLRIRAMNDFQFREQMPWSAAMSQALAEHYGRWALGWRWSQDEAAYGGGGPVKVWSRVGIARNTPEFFAAALVEWREWLESLARLFDAYPLDPDTVADQRALWRRAARDLIVHVMDRTECYDAWYGTCERVLIWFLERWGVESRFAQAMVDEAIGGRFESWTHPDPALVDDVAERLTESIPRLDDARESAVRPDDLERWLEVREQVQWHPARSRGGAEPDQPPSGDGAVDYISVFDAAIDPARAQGLLDALELMRADAAQQTPLSFEVIRRWQEHVLGVRMPPFRVHPAFAKGGRERYGIGPETQDQFNACLAQSEFDPDQPLRVSIRAARVYLDVCFFHPFDDGNARSAFLAALFVLAREGIVLESLGSLRMFSFYADDPEDAAWLARNIEMSTLMRNGMYTGD
jgi:Fic/DOC family